VSLTTRFFGALPDLVQVGAAGCCILWKEFGAGFP
jgi:hypothetical protein